MKIIFSSILIILLSLYGGCGIHGVFKKWIKIPSSKFRYKVYKDKSAIKWGSILILLNYIYVFLIILITFNKNPIISLQFLSCLILGNYLGYSIQKSQYKS